MDYGGECVVVDLLLGYIWFAELLQIIGKITVVVVVMD